MTKYFHVMTAGAASRVAVIVLGSLLPSMTIVPKVNASLPVTTEERAPGWMRPWYRWDAAWYAGISREGYTRNPGPGYSSLGFLPLLPAVMGLGATLGLDRYWVGLIVPNLAFVVGLGFFARIAFRLTGREDVAWRSCLLLMAYPWSFYFSAPYQESLGFALLTGAVLAWISDRPVVAAVAGALAPTARLHCTAFSAAIVAEWIVDRVRGRPTRRFAWPVAVAGGLGIFAFFSYLYFRFGDFLAHTHAHAAWGRKSPGLMNLVEAIIIPPRAASDLKDYVVAIGFLGLGLITLRKRGVFWASLALIPIIQAMSSGTVLSMSRVALLSFPAFIEAAELIRNRYAFGVIVTIGVLLQILMLKGFVS